MGFIDSSPKISHYPRYTNEELRNLVLSELDSIIHTPGCEMAANCLMDKRRTLTLMDIVSSCTDMGDVGADIGAGTGILGFAFLNAGGDFLYAVDDNLTCIKFISTVAEKLGFSGKISAIASDYSSFRAVHQLDVIISETIQSGLVCEPVVDAMRHAREYSHPGTRFIPQKAISSVRLSEAPSYLAPLPRGVKNDIPIRHENAKYLSSSRIYDEVDFRRNNATKVDAMIQLEANSNGFLQNVAIDTCLEFPNGQITGQFSTLCYTNYYPVSLWRKGEFRKNVANLLGKKQSIHEGEKVNLRIRYDYTGNKVFIKGVI